MSTRSSRRRRLRGVSLSCALTFPAVSVAQVPSDAVMPTVTVEGMQQDQVVTEGTGAYTAPAVTIGKQTQAIKDIPQSVSVVTRQRMDEQNLQSLGDVLEQTPGITVQDTNSYERSYYSRGYQIENIQYDGVPTQSGQGFVTQPDMAIYDRVEVLRGPAGIFNGVGEPGGTVNLVRKRPTSDFMLTGKATAGSWSNYRGEVDVSNRLNESGTLRGRFVGAYQDRDFFYDIANTKRTVGYGILEYDFAPATTLGVGLSYEKNDMIPMYGGVPRFADGGDLGLSRKDYVNAAWSRTDFERTTLFTDLNHRFNQDWRMRLGATYTQEIGHDQSGSLFGAVNRATGMGATLSAFDARFDSQQTALDASVEGTFDALGKRHDVLVGANFWDKTYDAQSQAMLVDNPAQNIFTFDPHDFSDFPTQVNPARAMTRGRTNTEQAGLYGSLRLTLADPLKLTLGGRSSYYRSKQTNRVTDMVTSRSRESGEFTPYGAITFDLNDEWTTYASYAEIFRPQANLNTVDGTPLDPATGQNYEVGIKGSLYDGRLNTSLAVFRIIEKNRSQIDPNAPNPCGASPSGTAACYVADGKVRSQGIDTEVSGAITPRWNVAAGYTFNTTKYLKDATASGAASANESQPYSTFTPKHIFKLWTDYRLPGAWQDVDVGGGVRVQSRTYKTNGDITIEQSMYALWDARVGYRVNKHVTTALNVNNIFDKNYYRTLGSARGSNWYGEPRSVMLTLQARY